MELMRVYKVSSRIPLCIDVHMVGNEVQVLIVDGSYPLSPHGISVDFLIHYACRIDIYSYSTGSSFILLDC